MSKRLATCHRRAPARQYAGMVAPIMESRAEQTLTSHDGGLLERARTQWQFGDWQSLVQINRDTLEHHPDRVELALFSAAARMQIGSIEEAREWFVLAKKWGSVQQQIARILIAGSYNSLGRAAILNKQMDLARVYIANSLKSSNPVADIQLLAEARHQFQKKQVSELVSNNVDLENTRNEKEIINFKSFNNLIEDIKSNLYRLHNYDFDLIVGIPRSGMMVAYHIGLMINIHVIDFNGLLNNHLLSKGWTRRVKHHLEYPQDAQRILVVDDSIASGKSLKEKMQLLPKSIKEKVTTLAIYSSKKDRIDVDIFFQHISVPRMFEWNIFQRKDLEYACVDIDGVLCIDPTNEQNDDGDRYVDFLLNAKPLYLPVYPINTLVTNRLEKYRKQTEEWLRKHEVKYNDLIMLDLPSKEDRIKSKIHVPHKAGVYSKNNALKLFIESSESQAKEIAELTNKSVYCVDNSVMY